jgi:hypothetical protein
MIYEPVFRQKVGDTGLEQHRPYGLPTQNKFFSPRK